VAGTQVYQPYGAPLSSAGLAESVYGFTGEQADPTGLVYLRARYYSPGSKQFLSHDAWPGMTNGFNYADVNPINRADPTGLSTLCWGRFGHVASSEGLWLRRAPKLSEDSKIRLLAYGTDLMLTHPSLRGIDNSYFWCMVFPLDKDDHGYVADEFLEHGWSPGPPDPICPGPTCSPFPPEYLPWDRLQFTRLPIEGSTGTDGFGANQFAYDTCASKPDSGCYYSYLRGLHNGLDFYVPWGTPVVWNASTPGTVFMLNSGDANPNVEVQSKDGYRVNFGHLSRQDVVAGQTVRPGQTIGATGDNHLHFGVRKSTTFYNPVYFFMSDLIDTIASFMGPYVEDEDYLSIKSFSISGTQWDQWFWDECPDMTGIERP
jgi:RHS repeat-associated protein